MVNCFYHPKTDGVAACKRCMIPLCEGCLQDRYCVECHKMAQYVLHGRSGKKHGDIVAEDNVRRGSLTRQLMINRLAGQVLAETPMASMPAFARKPIRKKAGKQEKDQRAAMLLTGAALAMAFGLGAMVSRPTAQAADTPASVETMDVTADRPVGTVHAPDSFHDLGRSYAAAAAAVANDKPAEQARDHAEAPAYRVPALAHRTVASQPAVQPAAPAGYQVPALTSDQVSAPAMRAPRPELPPQTAWIPVPEGDTQSDAPSQPKAHAARPTVALAWPIAGNTLRMTSYFKVHVTGANQVSVLNITVDGKPIAPVSQVTARNEVPIDTTRLGNGEHRLRVVAMTESGDTISSEEIPVSISN